MIKLFEKINKRINSLVYSFVSTGIILIMLAILIVWTDFLLRLVFGLLTLLVAYVFLYAGYKLWAIKKEIKEHFKL